MGDSQAIKKDGYNTKPDTAKGVTLLQKWGNTLRQVVASTWHPCCELGQGIFLPKDDLNILMAQVQSI